PAAGARTCRIAADQAGDGRYGPASQATSDVQVAKATQAIAFAALIDKVATDPSFTLSATGGGSANAVVFSTLSTACSVSGATVGIFAAGSCSIQANQAGDANYDAAAEVTQAFNIAFA